MPLSLKTMEVQIKGDQWNKRFRTVQVHKSALSFSSSTSLPFWLSEYPRGAADDCSKEQILPKNFLSSTKAKTEYLNNRSIRLRYS